MRAVVLEEYGDVGVLQLREIAPPTPGPDEVLVDVAHTALNRADLLQRMGLYPGPPMAHEVPGMEFAGTVAAVGERVDPANIGRRVMGIVGGGAYAEQLVTHERLLIDVPDSLPTSDGAAIPEVFITAFDALVVQGGLTSGGVALVHAGGSGVGTAAIQIGRAVGATVIVTASTDKIGPCLELGADRAIDYRSEDFVAEVKSFTGGAGADVILDVVGGEYLNRNLASVAHRGRIIQVGIMGGANTEISLGMLLGTRAQIIGTTLRSRPVEDKIAITRRFAREMLPLFGDATHDSRLRPVVDRRYALDQIAEAHTYMQSNASFGKIIIDVAGA